METFEQFMQRALHDPERGYYARKISTIGSRGDFTTAPMLSKLPARAIAAWISAEMKKHRCRNLIEIGPGTGALAKAIWQKLPYFQTLKTRLHLVETSQSLMDKQQRLLGSHFTWHHDIRTALEQCDGNAVIYSNELVDAFPVRCFRKSAEAWEELSLETTSPRTIRETWIPVQKYPDSSLFTQDFQIGQRIEIHESYQKWLNEWMPHWKRGSMLTIDYGSNAQNLYHRKPRGSLRGYFLQHRVEGFEIYQNIGLQDLTADVNFTDLLRWSEPFVQTSELVSLREFLLPHAKRNEALLDEQGPGGAFRVLKQTK